jgi:bifunctional non-homologous end joining protein LigD
LNQPPSREVEVDGRRLALTNLDKVIWPAAGFTKAAAMDYYARVAEAMLPHLAGRPLTRVRFPDGVDGQRFYEKRAPSHTPDWIRTAPIEFGSAGRVDFVVCDDRATLVWLCQLAAFELHPSLSLAKRIDRPTALVFDLDPGAPADIVDCCRVGLRVRDLFAELDLESFPKTSGSKGLQVYVPLNSACTYEQTKPFANAVAQLLESDTPDEVVSKQRKELRKGRVLVDWSQNDGAKTTVAVYSLRARERPWVSTPLEWAEVEAVLRRRKRELAIESLRFEAEDVVARVAERGDLFAPVLERKQKLPSRAP